MIKPKASIQLSSSTPPSALKHCQGPSMPMRCSQCLVTPRTTDRGNLATVQLSSFSTAAAYDSRRLRHCWTEMSIHENASCESWVKAQKERVLPIPERCIPVIEAYKKQRMNRPDSPYFFAGRNRGSAISVRTLARDVSLCARRSLGRHVTPTSYATHSQPIYSLVVPIYAKSRACWAMNTYRQPSAIQ